MSPSDRVMVGIASIPERAAALERVVDSLAPQVDRLVVTLNEYRQVPTFLGRHLSVVPMLRSADNGGDAEKFAVVDDWDGIVATCDDDVLYPDDYIAQLVDGLGRYAPGTAVGFHGGKTLGWNGSALAASHKRIRCLGDLDADDADVNVLGTGAMAYHAAETPVWRDVFRFPNMADVQMACHARAFGIPMVALAHAEGWMQDICPPAGRRIYESNAMRDGSACDTRARRETAVAKFDWTAVAPARPRVRVSIATCDRPGKLLELLEDLVVESRWIDIELCVYEDPAGPSYGQARELCESQGWRWFRFPERLGRRGFYRLVDRQLNDAGSSNADWFLFLPDDVRLTRHTIPRAIALWDRLDDPATLTLWRLRSLEGMTNWTGKHALQHDAATEIFHVDGLYLCRRETLRLLEYGCPDPRPSKFTGSGVGRLISMALDRAGKRMYRVDRSLVTCNDGGVSIMNPVERTRNPAVAL